MGYPHVNDLNLSHNSFNKANPKPPLIAKPNISACGFPKSAIISPCHGCTNPTILLALSHDINANERSKAEFRHEQQPLGSSRWNPTPEQLLALKELYRRGTRTPSAAQIQQIATRLRRFGKIEGKNVFYWFQNHKARERQKRRRELETEQPPPPQQQEQRQQQCDTEKSLEKKESVFSLPIIKQTKNKGTPSNFNKLSEEFISTQGWVQIKEKELQQRRSAVGKVLNNQNLCSFKTHQENINITTLEDENRDDQTLELFPLGSHDLNGIDISKKDTTQMAIRAINTTFKQNQYFEFLPLKN